MKNDRLPNIVLCGHQSRTKQKKAVTHMVVTLIYMIGMPNTAPVPCLLSLTCQRSSSSCFFLKLGTWLIQITLCYEGNSLDWMYKEPCLYIFSIRENFPKIKLENPLKDQAQQTFFSFQQNKQIIPRLYKNKKKIQNKDSFLMGWCCSIGMLSLPYVSSF